MGVVGNPGHLGSDLDRFSNCPELHRWFLEIQDSGQIAHIKQDGYTFHFSELNDGDYCFISLSTSEKHPLAVTRNRRGCADTRSAEPSRKVSITGCGCNPEPCCFRAKPDQNGAETIGDLGRDQTAGIPDPAAHIGLRTRIPEKLPGFPRGNS